MTIFEMILVVCMQANGKECAVFRSQMSQTECVVKIQRYIEKYGMKPNEPPYVESAECVNTGYSDESGSSTSEE